MCRKLRTQAEDVEYARKQLKEACSAKELRMAQAMLLPEQMGVGLETVSKMLGVSRKTVTELRARLSRKRGGIKEKGQWGGRRYGKMSVEQEKEFLEPWLEQARLGQILVLAPLREALARQLGEAVSEPYIYRLLARHGWRKVAQDTRHPKADAEQQLDWEKEVLRHFQWVAEMLRFAEWKYSMAMRLGADLKPRALRLTAEKTELSASMKAFVVRVIQ